MSESQFLEHLSLRDRKKVWCREDIVSAAQRLFADNGIDATTVADIAKAAGVSTPTVFNYFGSKDGILIALIEDSTRQAREMEHHLPHHKGASLTVLILELFSRISSRTLEIADKRVWRYAEAALIRQPDTDFARTFRTVDVQLLEAISGFFDRFELVTRSGTPYSPAYTGRIFHDAWNPLYLDLIADDAQTLKEHDAKVCAHLAPLVTLLFTDKCAKNPRWKAR